MDLLPDFHSYLHCYRLIDAIAADFLIVVVSMRQFHVFGKPFYDSMIRSFDEVFGSRQ